MINSIITEFSQNHPGYSCRIRRVPYGYFLIIRKGEEVIACDKVRVKIGEIANELNRLISR